MRSEPGRPGAAGRPERSDQRRGPGVPDPDRVDPAVLGALLARYGWVHRGGGAGRYAHWSPPDDQEPDTSLLVPARRDFEDAGELVEEAVAGLARSAHPSAPQILAALAVPGDEIRWRRELPGAGGALAWPAEDGLRSAARAMLAAAAKAGRIRAAYFGSRLDEFAADFLEQVLVVAPGTGAGLLTAYTPAPGARPAATTLVRALEAVREAVDYRRATGRPDAFDSAVRVGVSRELVESVTRLVRGAERAEVTLAWSPEVGVPRGFGNRPLRLEFSPGDLPALEEAGQRLEHSEPAVEVLVTGVVVRLKRPAAGGPGVVRLRVLAGADVDEVRVRLEERDYVTAVRAHLGGAPVRLAGRLEPKGGFRRLGQPRELVILRLDAAERDRLLKSLRAPREDASGTSPRP